MDTPSLLTKYAHLGVCSLPHYAQTLIPLPDYNYIDWHCKIYVQAKKCVDLNSVTTRQISDSSLPIKNNQTFNCEKNYCSKFNYETYNFFFGKFATLICIADFDNFFYITYHLVEYLRNFGYLLKYLICNQSFIIYAIGFDDCDIPRRFFLWSKPITTVWRNNSNWKPFIWSLLRSRVIYPQCNQQNVQEWS